jgi:hypothetical protein
MASMGKPETKVSELCQEIGISRQTLYRHASANGEAYPDGVRVLSRRWRRTRLRTFENQGCETGDVSVRRPCPGERCGRAYGNWARPGSSGDRASRGRSADLRQVRTPQSRGADVTHVLNLCDRLLTHRGKSPPANAHTGYRTKRLVTAHLDGSSLPLSGEITRLVSIPPRMVTMTCPSPAWGKLTTPSAGGMKYGDPSGFENA